MDDAAPARYDISKDVLFAPQEKIDVTAVAAAQTPWWNRTLTEVNDAVVRLGVLDGDFHWRQHEAEDEFFYVVEGVLVIETRMAPCASSPARQSPSRAARCTSPALRAGWWC